MGASCNIYKSVLFDMDGVIVDSMRLHAESWRRVFSEELGIELSEGDIFKREGMSGLPSIIDILNEKGAPIPGDEELIGLREKKIRIFDAKRVKIFLFVREILTFLKSKNVRLGLVTGSLRTTVDKILTDDIISFFEVIVTPDDIVNGKPHPEPYEKGMKGLLSGKEDTLAVENAPMGIMSARSAGIDCYAIETTLSESYLSGASRVFKSHGDLYRHFVGLYGGDSCALHGM
jgi:beta-phosphoglucomutase